MLMFFNVVRVIYAAQGSRFKIIKLIDPLNLMPSYYENIFIKRFDNYLLTHIIAFSS